MQRNSPGIAAFFRRGIPGAFSRPSRRTRGPALEPPLSRERRHGETDRDGADEPAGTRPRGALPGTAASRRAEVHPPPKAKTKGKKERPGEELRKTYDLLRRIRSDAGNGRAEERIGDWTDRATGLYRRAIRAGEQGDPRRAGEIGTAAHDLARAVDHARNAARLDRADPDLPPPPEGDGPEDIGESGPAASLNRAYDVSHPRGRADTARRPDAKFYLDAARDLYNAARRDVEAGRDERGGELARAAEAMTHVPEHLDNAGEPDGPRDGRPPEPKKKDRPRGEPGPPSPPKAKGDRPGPARPQSAATAAA